MHISLIANGFGAAVSDLDLRDNALESRGDALVQALDQHQLLAFRETDLDQQEYERLGQAIGTLEDFPDFGNTIGGKSLALSNLGLDGKIMAKDDMMRRNIAGDALWHTDHTYMPNRARYSFLKAEVVPSHGGETQYANTCLAYEALPEGMKQRLEGLVGLHSLKYSRSLVGFTDWPEEQSMGLLTIPQPLVFENPRSGRKSLYIASHIGEIVGMETAAARKLVGELIDFATQPQFVYAHKWRPGDVLVWDDRATMHRRAPYDDMHELRRLRTMRVIEPSDLYDPEAEYVIH
ncbi:MAG: TauD/TfdA family dioxygenase [Novosphingobium sp.]|nr:TauD/TfdA family dioxygenase [Novosphingobium sp.]